MHRRYLFTNIYNGISNNVCRGLGGDMREIKFKYYLQTKYNDGKPEEKMVYTYTLGDIWSGSFSHTNLKVIARCEYTGLKDKNGKGLIEVYEGDIIDIFCIIKGNIHEMEPEESDIVIPQMGTKAWDMAYQKAMVRGYDFTE